MYRFFLGMVALLTVTGLAVFTLQHSSQVYTVTNTASVATIDVMPATTSSTTIIDRSRTSSTTLQVPIAVYHSIRETSASEPASVRQFSLPPAEFDKQMQYLHDNNFHTITFAELFDAVMHGTPLPEKPIILSFDDGWRTQFTEAVPILKKYDFTATFFLYPNVIEHENYITWDEARALSDTGMEIGSHSKSHQYMTKQTPEEQLFEVEQSKAILEEKLGVVVTSFAYPFGLFDTNLQAILQNAGYTAARGLGTGVTHSPESLYELSSYLIRNDFFDFQYFVNQVQ